MNFSLKHVFQSAAVAAILEVAIDVIRSQSFHLIAVGMYTIIQLVFFFVVLTVAASAAALFKSFIGIQKALFFLVSLAPSAFSYFEFYRDASYYQQGGSILIQNHQTTSAGIESFILNIASSAIIALVATAIYFRKEMRQTAAKATDV